MRQNYLATLIFLFILTASFAQDKKTSALFQRETPLEVKIAFSMKEIRRSTSDSVYFPTILNFRKEDGTWDSIAVSIRARGNFRRNKCFFPPLRMKIKKKDAKNTIFEGNKVLKIVLPCQTGPAYNTLIIKEYACYQMYEPITPHTFNTRLLNITLKNETGKLGKIHSLQGFFIEDDDVVAERFDAKVIEGLNVHPLKLQDTAAVKHDFFQYMIANTDWSALANHNVKVMVTNSSRYIPLAYDFDMAGMVDAPYATINETLDIHSVKERLYRGFCRDKTLFEPIRQHYLQREAKIFEALNAQSQYLDPRELNGMKKFLEEFFNTLKNDGRFKSNIVNACRTK